MAEIEFAWNHAKAASNERKHGVSFFDAVTAMSDPFRLDEFEGEFDGEPRWRSLGLFQGEVILFIAHTSWSEDELEVIRIISARRATSRERQRYDQNRIQNAR